MNVGKSIGRIKDGVGSWGGDSSSHAVTPRRCVNAVRGGDIQHGHAASYCTCYKARTVVSRQRDGVIARQPAEYTFLRVLPVFVISKRQLS